MPGGRSPCSPRPSGTAQARHRGRGRSCCPSDATPATAAAAAAPKQLGRRQTPYSPLALAAVVAVVAVALLGLATLPLSLPGAEAFTAPDQLQAILAFRDANVNKSASWARTLAGWQCPTDPSDSDSACDPCSKDWSGNWEYIHCRGAGGLYGEGSTGDFNGRITNVHITDQNLEGPPPRELCKLQYLRELDLDGSNFNGPFPDWVITCLPQLQELDMSYNRLTGTIPPEIATKTLLQEIKLENNGMVGTIPPALGSMPRLRVLRLEYNQFSGPIPKELSQLSNTLNVLELARNNFEGDLMALATARPMSVTVEDNPRLCGMVPAGVRFASGYNPYNTRLGRPCDE